MTPRISFTLLALLLTVVLPWWASGLVLLILIFSFSWYYEAVLMVLVYDLLYGSGFFYLTIICLLLVPLTEEIKKRLYVFS